MSPGILGGTYPAFVERCTPYEPELRRYAARLTGNEADADDIVQEAFIRALVAWRTVNPDVALRAWLYKIVENCFISRYRKARNYQRWLADNPDEIRNNFHPEPEAVDDALSSEVVGALANLPDDERDIIERAARGATARTIARELRKPLGTVLSKLYRGRAKLEVDLADYAATFGYKRARPRGSSCA